MQRHTIYLRIFPLHSGQPDLDFSIFSTFPHAPYLDRHESRHFEQYLCLHGNTTGFISGSRQMPHSSCIDSSITCYILLLSLRWFIFSYAPLLNTKSTIHRLISLRDTIIVLHGGVSTMSINLSDLCKCIYR